MKPRYEFRFLISPEMALQVRNFVDVYLDHDANCLGKPDLSYPVHTVELDSSDWKMLWRKATGQQDCWKLRLRYYDDEPGSLVYCEANHQVGDVVVKHRCGVARTAVEQILNGQMPEPDLFAGDARAAGDLERFVELLLQLNARPRLHVRCLREAYESDDGHHRVSLDRDIAVSEVTGTDGLLPMQMQRPVEFPRHNVLLELRFIERFPSWYQFMVETLGLSALPAWNQDYEEICCAGFRRGLGPRLHDFVL